MKVNNGLVLEPRKMGHGVGPCLAEHAKSGWRHAPLTSGGGILVAWTVPLACPTHHRMCVPYPLDRLRHHQLDGL
jgi:hypothetical protein